MGDVEEVISIQIHLMRVNQSQQTRTLYMNNLIGKAFSASTVDIARRADVAQLS
jgi:hypothetical protein